MTRFTITDGSNRFFNTSRNDFRMLHDIAGRFNTSWNEHHVIRQAVPPQRAVFVLMPRIREFDTQCADIGLIEHGQNEIQRHVEHMRAVPISPTAMQPHAVSRNSFNCLVDRRDVPLDCCNKLRIRQLAIEHRPVHREIRRVDLHEKSGIVYRAIFVSHFARQRLKIGVARIVIRVYQRAGNDSW
jgi:hypothetical protein